ncbi:cupin domain-containing protein [Clostridium sp. DSM 17811]|nr:cupin domain-containing protein [Clostridium sp. DSM 17811]
MYNVYEPYPYFINTPIYNPYNAYNLYKPYPCPYYITSTNEMEYDSKSNFLQSANLYDDGSIQLKDYGPEPFVVNIEKATKQNNTYRTALWTGSYLQLTLMSIKVGEDIGLEVHPLLDQFIRIEEGQGLIKMGDSKHTLNFQKNVYDDFAFIIPAGKWHNLINTGDIPINLYSIYAPPQHPAGTVHETKADAAEENHDNYVQNGQRSHRQNKEFTPSELAQYDGTMGKPAYVAVKGIVYDVSNNSSWIEAAHYGLTAGKDLSPQFESCHGVLSNLANIPNVGVLKG